MTPLVLVVLAGCVEIPRDTAIPGTAPWTVQELWSDASPEPTARIVVGEVVVTSPRTAEGLAFYVQAPGGGAASGLRVETWGPMPGIPPAVGTSVALRGWFIPGEKGPVLGLDDGDDLVVLGPSETTPTPWDDGAQRAYTLIDLPGLTLTSSPDPLGHADTDGPVALDSAFGVPLPGWGARGDLLGIATSEGRVAPRTPEDWTGSLEGDDPVTTDLTALRTGVHPEGTPVVLQGFVQAAPWSPDGRRTLVQDDEGGGLWVDTEGFVDPATAPGDVGTWRGEVRSEGVGLRLRTWEAPAITGSGAPVTTTVPADGALLEATWSGLGPPDRYGRRSTSEGALLDDTFVDLSGLPDPATVTGPVRVTGTGQVIHHPVEWVP